MSGSSKLWLLVHLVFPLLPFAMGGIIRWLFGPFSISTFNASELSMSLGLLSLFVQQSLQRSNQSLALGTTKEDQQAAALWFLMAAIFFFVLFGVLTGTEALISNQHINVSIDTLKKAHILVFLSSIPLVVYTHRVQKSFNLKTSI